MDDISHAMRIVLVNTFSFLVYSTIFKHTSLYFFFSINISLGKKCADFLLQCHFAGCTVCV